MVQNCSYSLVDSMEQMGREKKPLIAGQCTGTLSYAVPCSKGNIYQLVGEMCKIARRLTGR